MKTPTCGRSTASERPAAPGWRRSATPSCLRCCPASSATRCCGLRSTSGPPPSSALSAPAGIGQELKRVIGFNIYEEVSAIVILILLIVVAIDLISERGPPPLHRRYRVRMSGTAIDLAAERARHPEVFRGKGWLRWLLLAGVFCLPVLSDVAVRFRPRLHRPAEGLGDRAADAGLVDHSPNGTTPNCGGRCWKPWRWPISAPCWR